MSETTGKSINYTVQNYAQQGWQCPICKRILAPFITECPCQWQGQQSYITSDFYKIGGSE